MVTGRGTGIGAPIARRLASEAADLDEMRIDDLIGLAGLPPVRDSRRLADGPGFCMIG